MQSVRWLEAYWRAGTAPEDGSWIDLRGASMEPAYADGDSLLVRPLIGAPPVRPGDVVVARRGERLVTHRILELRGGMVITKGDASPRADSPVPIGSLLGRVAGARRISLGARGWHRVKRWIRRVLEV